VFGRGRGSQCSVSGQAGVRGSRPRRIHGRAGDDRTLSREREIRRVTELANLDGCRIALDAWDLIIVSIFCHLPAPVRRALHREVVAGLRPGEHSVLDVRP